MMAMVFFISLFQNNNIEETSRKEPMMVKVYSLSDMVTYTMVNSKTVKEKAKEYIISTTEIDMKDNLNLV